MMVAESQASPTRRKRLSAWARNNSYNLFIVLIVGLMVLFYYFRTIVVVIHPGEAGVLYRMFFGGTVTDYVYPEGLQIVQPWNKMYVYDIRIQTVKHDLNVLTNKGLPITLSLAIRYRPQREMLGVMHQHVGPDYVNTIVIPQVESVLRKNIGKEDPEVIYTNKGGILNDIILLALEEASRKYVQIDDIIIRTVTLPEEIRTAIEAKLVEQQKERAYEFKLAREEKEAERKRIESRGIRDYQSTISETLTQDLLRWQGVQATLQLSESQNAKVVVIGGGESGLPIILDTSSRAGDAP